MNHKVGYVYTAISVHGKERYPAENAQFRIWGRWDSSQQKVEQDAHAVEEQQESNVATDAEKSSWLPLPQRNH
jgi:hypothetical protein